ncbi:MAG: Tetraacyldisaccharide 4'-kinase [Chlamydiae bacterium]|nr:Tetraacyldisaccharide 4'-kinase [Chlamydiota bacterium]
MNVESQIIDIIEGKKSAPITKALLQAMSQGYRVGAYARNLAYDAFIPSQTLPVPVISIGNIVVGGTGKTPFVHYLAKQLVSHMKVAILSRGYRRKGNNTLLVTKESSPNEVGDEPYFLAQKLPEAQVIVGPNRYSSGLKAATLGAEVILLDDGMQHRSLLRDIEIVVMHADDLFGKGYYLPRGFLRDSPRRLKAADQIILTGVKNAEDFAKQKERIRKFTDAPITAMEMTATKAGEIKSKKVASFCAIARPERFMSTLKDLGAEVVMHREKPDHFSFSEEELEVFSNEAKTSGAECLVCTEKDAVKLSPKLQTTLPIIPLAITLTPSHGKEELETLMDHMIEVCQ